MEEPHTESIEQLARAIEQRGLTTPARIMIDIIAPLGFLASQVTLFARPFIPGNRWTRTIDALCDARGWRMLHDLLNRVSVIFLRVGERGRNRGGTDGSKRSER